MIRRRGFWIGLVAALLLPAGVALAKGPSDMVAIVGPGLDGKVQVKDTELVLALSIGQLEDLSAPVDAPTNPGPAYEITRYFKYEGNYVAFDRVRYHPGTGDGPGYVYYIGIDNGWSGLDGKWFRATPEGEQAMRSVLSANGVQGANWSQSGWGALGLVVAGVALGLAGSRLFPLRKPA